MSSSTQHPKTNIVKLNQPSSSSAARDNTGVDGVSFQFLFFFYKDFNQTSSRIHNQLASMLSFFFLSFHFI